MKHNIKTILAAAAILAIALPSCRDAKKGDLPVIDVRETYTEKEIVLTDIGDVTYLHLESDNDEYLYNGSISAITENTIVVADYATGSILFFSMDGKPKSRFNRLGRGPEEYLQIINVGYDETTDELFVVDNFNSIQVYSSDGKHKRKLLPPNGVLIAEMTVFDDSSLLFFDAGRSRRRLLEDERLLSTEDLASLFYRISRADGTVLDSLKFQLPPVFVGLDMGNGHRISGLSVHAVKSPQGVFICNPESDTIFLYSKELELIPVINKIPLVTSMTPMVHMNNCIDAGDYQFVEVVTVKEGEEYIGIFPKEYYACDKRTNEIFRPKMILPDYDDKEFVMNAMKVGKCDDGGYFFELDLSELKQAYRDNKLNGKLKELVATLDEDFDNNVYALCRFRRQ